MPVFRSDRIGGKPWAARVKRSGENYSLGCHATREEAAAAEDAFKATHPSVRDTLPTHCRNNHEYTAETTYVNPKGNRGCRVCRKIKDHERTERNGIRSIAWGDQRGHKPPREDAFTRKEIMEARYGAA